MKKRVFVLGLDGMPFSLLQDDCFKESMPVLCSLLGDYHGHVLTSVYPSVSNVAWTSFFTGKTPAEHGIFGFCDRTVFPFGINLVTAKNRKCAAIWETLETTRKKIVINVPGTYPPNPINGLMVSDFLCPDIQKATYPIDYHKHLKDMGYIIDVDAWLARTNLELFLNDLFAATCKRFELAFSLLSEDWDYFQLHIMETDRLMHFCFSYLVRHIENAVSELINRLLKKIDDYIDKLITILADTSGIIILSDHGFCEVKAEVQLNRWLELEHLLVLNKSRCINDYHESTCCYSLTPGRIYLNLKGREPQGAVEEKDYHCVRGIIKNKLQSLVDPNTGECIIEKVLLREEIYCGSYSKMAPDLLVCAKNGYDLKSSCQESEIFRQSEMQGMHTYHDAMIIGINIDVSEIKSIDRVYPIIMEYLL